MKYKLGLTLKFYLKKAWFAILYEVLALRYPAKPRVGSVVSCFGIGYPHMKGKKYVCTAVFDDGNIGIKGNLRLDFADFRVVPISEWYTRDIRVLLQVVLTNIDDFFLRILPDKVGLCSLVDSLKITKLITLEEAAVLNAYIKENRPYDVKSYGFYGWERGDLESRKNWLELQLSKLMYDQDRYGAWEVNVDFVKKVIISKDMVPATKDKPAEIGFAERYYDKGDIFRLENNQVIEIISGPVKLEGHWMYDVDAHEIDLELTVSGRVTTFVNNEPYC